MSKIHELSKKFNDESLDSESHFQLLHGKHKEMVCVSTAKTRYDWKDKIYQHDDTLEIVRDLSQDHTRNIYISQSGFDKERNVNDISALTSIFVDMDVYKHPALADEPPDRVLKIVLEDFPWLPTPTLLAFSGKGLYLIWILETPLGRDRLPDWQLVEELLVEKLRIVGADQSVKDASRVLRVCGSVNTSSGKKVTYKQIAEPVPFDFLQKIILDNCQEKKPTKPRVVSDNSKIKSKPVINKQIAISGNVVTFYNELSLAYARMHDLRRVAKIRAPLMDYRKRFLFCFAVAVAWYCSTQESMERELFYFIQNFFADPEKYDVKLVRNVIKKVGGERYKIKNRAIINMLDITNFEQYTLKTLINEHYIYQRKEAKRREAGVRPQKEYLAQQSAESEQRKQKAKQLKQEGLTAKDIAQKMNIALNTVYRYLRF